MRWQLAKPTPAQTDQDSWGKSTRGRLQENFPEQHCGSFVAGSLGHDLQAAHSINLHWSCLAAGSTSSEAEMLLLPPSLPHCKTCHDASRGTFGRAACGS